MCACDLVSHYHALLVCLDVHEENLVQLFLTDDDSATLTLAKLVCMYELCVSVCVCVHARVVCLCGLLGSIF